MNPPATRQEPVVFENAGQRLFGMFHIPEPPHAPPFPAVVMLHGFAGHKIEPHRLFVKAARRFAAEGILALRFDFRGCGESDGDSEDLSIEGEIGDAKAALALVRGRGDVRRECVGLLGMSLGGSIAACVAGAERGAVRCLVLWAAVALTLVSGAQYLLDGRAAATAFVAARAETIARLAPLPLDVWDRQGQHTFFGPTSLHELVYLAVQHDRVHGEQMERIEVRS